MSEFLSSWPAIACLFVIGLIFMILGIIKTKKANFIKPHNKYELYPSVNSFVYKWVKVRGLHGPRFAVKFLDENKNEVVGLMDTHYSKKFGTVKEHMNERVYYWKCSSELRDNRVDEQPIEYCVHFCDNKCYEPVYKAEKHDANSFIFAAFFFLLVAVLLIVI